MKQPFAYIVPGFVLFLAGCGLFGEKPANGFEQVLYQPPFKAISDSIDRSPDDAALLLRRAQLLSQNNHQDIAYYDYRKSWELKPLENTGLLYAANLFLTGRNKDAIALLDSCRHRYPGNIQFTRRLAEAWAQSGRDSMAISLYNEILQSDSANFDALYEKGMLFAVMKDTAQAIKTLEKAYRLQPVMQTGLGLAHLYAATKNPRALELCEALQKRDSSREFVDPLFLEAIYYTNVKNYDKALPLFDECINRDWHFIEPYIERGIIFYDKRNFGEALKNFGKAIDIDYTYADAYYWSGRCMEATGKKNEALDLYYKAIAFDKNFTEAKEAVKRLKK